VNGRYMLLIGCACRCWMVYVVDGLYLSLLGGTHRRCRVRAFDQLYTSSMVGGYQPCCGPAVDLVEPLALLWNQYRSCGIRTRQAHRGGEFAWLSWTHGCSPHRWRVKISPHPSARGGARVGLRRSCFGVHGGFEVAEDNTWEY